MPGGLEVATVHGVVRNRHHLVDLLQAQGPHRLTSVRLVADGRADLGDLEHFPGHSSHTPCPARARSIAAGATSSIDRPRRAAISSGRCRPLSASMVAWTMLIGLSEPSDLDNTS